MLEALIVILLIFWLVGAFTHVAGDLIHILLIVVAFVLFIRIIQGRSV